MNDIVAALERRVAALEEQLVTQKPQAPTRLVAPLEVVDDEGRTILTVSSTRHDTSIRLYNKGGKAVATLGVDGTAAGYLSIRNAESTLVALLDVERSGARLSLEDHERRGGVSIFGGDSGDNSGGGINIAGTAGGVALSLWATATGGEVTVCDEHDRQLLRLPEVPPASAE